MNALVINNSRAADYAKNKHLILDIYRASRHDVTLDAIIVGCLGSWDPINESVFKQLRLTLEQIKKLAITMTIQVPKRSAYDIPDAHFRRGRSSCDLKSLIDSSKSLTYRTYLTLLHSHYSFV